MCESPGYLLKVQIDPVDKLLRFDTSSKFFCGTDWASLCSYDSSSTDIFEL